MQTLWNANASISSTGRGGKFNKLFKTFKKVSNGFYSLHWVTVQVALGSGHCFNVWIGDLFKWKLFTEVDIVNDRNFKWRYLHSKMKHIDMILITISKATGEKETLKQIIWASIFCSPTDRREYKRRKLTRGKTLQPIITIQAILS